MHFASYANVEEGFYPKRAQRAYAEGIKKTNDLVLRLEKQKRLVPTDAPSRRMEHDAGTAVTAVPASLLGCDYVDRELLVQRTTSPAQWPDGSRNVGGLRLDVLLADSADRTPIVGELKLPGDVDPFLRTGPGSGLRRPPCDQPTVRPHAAIPGSWQVSRTDRSSAR